MPADSGFQQQFLVAQDIGQPGLHAVHQQQVSSAPTQEQHVLRATTDPATMRALDAVGHAIHTGELNRSNRHQEKFKYSHKLKVPSELLVGDKVDISKSTVGGAPYLAVEGAILSAPTSISKGLDELYRASLLAQKLQAERMRQAEAMKKGAEYSQRLVKDSELQAPPDYLAAGTNSNSGFQAPLCVNQQQQRIEVNALEEALNLKRREPFSPLAVCSGTSESSGSKPAAGTYSSSSVSSSLDPADRPDRCPAWTDGG